MAGSHYIHKKLHLKEVLVHVAAAGDNADWMGTYQNKEGFTAKDVFSNSEFFRMKKTEEREHCQHTREECCGAFPGCLGFFFLMEEF